MTHLALVPAIVTLPCDLCPEPATHEWSSGCCLAHRVVCDKHHEALLSDVRAVRNDNVALMCWGTPAHRLITVDLSHWEI